jgi:protein PhnA
MSIESTLIERSGNKCELCGSSESLSVVAVAPKDGSNSDDCVLLCSTCNSSITENSITDTTHWRCLNESMWSTTTAVQVLAWQQLSFLSQAGETWAQDLLDMLYLDETPLSWAQSGLAARQAGGSEQAIDSNGQVLAAGDNVYLIKDLPVKGAGFTAKQGTTVRGISLTSNPEHIEGRVNGQKIVILTKFVKKV